jgi:ATP-binding cassette subfamily C exporter for protease/lipase
MTNKSENNNSSTALDKSYVIENTGMDKFIRENANSVKSILLISLLINLISLSPTWFMLEVYDRVVSSSNHRTLFYLIIGVMGLYFFQGCLDLVRGSYGKKLAILFEDKFIKPTFVNSYQAKNNNSIGGVPESIMADLDAIKNFFQSSILFNLIDAPIALLVIILIFSYKPILGLLVLIVALVAILVTVFNYFYVYPLLNKSRSKFNFNLGSLNRLSRSSDTILAMGMQNKLFERWKAHHDNFLQMQNQSSLQSSNSALLIKYAQSIEPSAILGIGSLLIIMGELDANSSALIVVSMLAVRAIAPLAALSIGIGTLVDLRVSFQNFYEFANLISEPKKSIELPAPVGHLSLTNVTYSPNSNSDYILKSISFKLAAGELLALIGPSGAGKSTLAKLILGLIQPTHGEVRLDDANIYHWNKSHLGKYLGYLSQDTELFEGTIRDNIVRFGDCDEELLETIINVSGISNWINLLPDGLSSVIKGGESSVLLSFGQKQQVNIARAIYGNPKLIVMDEPNSNLDESGDKALIASLQYLKSINCTTIIVTQRNNTLEMVDKILIISDGVAKAFGPAKEILNKLMSSKQA